MIKTRPLRGKRPVRAVFGALAAALMLTTAALAQYQQAPELDALVESGALPPFDEL